MPPSVVLQIVALWLLLLAAILVDDGTPTPRREPGPAPATGGACPFCGLGYEAAEVGQPCPCWEGWRWF